MTFALWVGVLLRRDTHERALRVVGHTGGRKWVVRGVVGAPAAMSRQRLDTVSLAEVTQLGEDDRKAVMEMVRDGEMDMGEVGLYVHVHRPMLSSTLLVVSVW